MRKFIHFCIRMLYVPFFLLVGNGVAIYLVVDGHSKLWLLAWISLFLALSFLAEKLLPFDLLFNKSIGDLRRDTVHAIVNETLTLVGILSLALFQDHLSLAPIWPSDWPMALQLFLAILIADIGISLAHYASHRINILWRLHAIHHSVMRMYGFNGLMKHPFHQLI